jgi:MFS family permease
MRSALPGSVRRLSLVLVLSATADAFSLVALLWYLTVSRAGAGALGGLVLAAGLPAVASGPLIGRLLERSPVRPLLAADNLGRAAILLTITGLAAGGALRLPVLFLLVALTGLLSPVTYAGSRVLLPELVTAAQLVAANRLLAVGDQFPLLAGPAAAGVTASALGGPGALTIPAAALVLAARAAWRLPAPAPGQAASQPPAPERAAPERAAPEQTAPEREPREPDDPGELDDSGERGEARGRGRWRTPGLQAVLALTGAYFLAYGPLEPAMPLYAHHRLHAGAVGYGALWSVFGAGALLGLLAVRPLARLRPGLVNAAGAAAWGLVTLPLVLITALPGALAVMFAGGLIWGPYGVIEVMTIQAVTPRHRHGTVFGLRRAIQVAATPAGAAVGGLLLTRLDPQAVIGVAAGACVLAGAAGLLYPPLRRLPRPPAAPGRPARAATWFARPGSGQARPHADRLQAGYRSLRSRRAHPAGRAGGAGRLRLRRDERPLPPVAGGAGP